jgi:dolichol-phosphate mannosyltransferase
MTHSLPTAARSAPRISVVFSFYNEARVLPELIVRTRRTLAALCERGVVTGYEMVFVDDASTDGSLEVLSAARQEQDDLVVLRMSRNVGPSEGVLAGFAYATGDVVVYLDADLQDPPEVIAEVVRVWLERPDVDVVHTTRTKRHGEHPMKLALTKAGYRLIRAISNVALPVDSGDFKLLSRRAVNEILRLREQNPYLRGMVGWIGFGQAQVFYERAPRLDGRENTKLPVLSRRVISAWLDRALISFSDVPLKAVLAAGFAISALALVHMAAVLVPVLVAGEDASGPFLMSVVLLLGGLQLSAIGIAGLYLHTIFLQAKNRPPYIVDSTLPPGLTPHRPRSSHADPSRDRAT